MSVLAWVADVLPESARPMWRGPASEAGVGLAFAGEDHPTPDVRVILARRAAVGPQVLDTCPGARVVQWVGRFPTTVDEVGLRVAGVALETWPLISRVTVAEHVFALMLACCRHIVVGDTGTRNGLYLERGATPQLTDESHIAWNWLSLPVQELAGRTLGLLGAGEIALEVAVRARCFGMKVLYSNRRRLPPAWEQRLGLSYRALADLAAESDVLSVHVPHTADTVGLVSREVLAAMHDGALVVNTARGAVVDELALVEELKRGRLRAALDVFREEPLPVDHPLAQLPGTVLSPHLGGGCAGGLGADLARLFRHLAAAGRPDA